MLALTCKQMALGSVHLKQTGTAAVRLNSGREHLSVQVTRPGANSKVVLQNCSTYKLRIHCATAPSKHKFFSYTHADLLFLYSTEIDNGPHSISLFCFFFCGLTLADFVIGNFTYPNITRKSENLNDWLRCSLHQQHQKLVCSPPYYNDPKSKIVAKNKHKQESGSCLPFQQMHPWE